MSTSNPTYILKNTVDQPDSTGDNLYRFEGSVNFYDALGNAYSKDLVLNALKGNVATVYSTATAIATSGQAVITGGTGLALTLAAPTAGCFCQIWVASLASGAVTVKTPTGVTFDGTNNTATFSTAGMMLQVAYKSATQWQIAYNDGVTFSST